uniref:Beta-lactamase-related domain-containing protein n=1 Tax=Ditylenchus dipsaci TaxID=166011 RepID=A0A915E3N3_9BILA
MQLRKVSCNIGLAYSSAFSAIVSVLMPRWYGKPNVRVNGFVDERFKDMSNIFRENFVDGFERDGSHLSVYHKGYLVVDLWAGMADTSKAKLWTRIHRQGQLRWDDKVTKYWKQYGQNGKENTTVEHILSHQSGLPYIDEKILISDVVNKSSLLAKLAAAKAIWEPGTATGYHISLEQFFEEEIAEPNGLDISIGLKTAEVPHKLSFLSLPDSWEVVRDIWWTLE